MRATEFTSSPVMAKIERTGQIVQILRHEDHVQFSDDPGWFLVNTEPGRRTGTGVKWIPDSTRFAWVKKFDSLKEAFDQPYPLTWEKSEADDSVDALARLPDGSNLSIMFNQDLDDEGQGIYSVEFWRDNSQEVTGQGDSQRVFATVLAAIAQFIKKRKPEQLYFSANKDVEPGQKAGSRSNLYTSLVRRYATALGYEADVSDFAGSTTYKLYKLYEQKQPVTEARMPRAIEEFLDSLNPDDCGVEDIGAYRIHFEGFTSDCKSSADYRRDPEAVYQQVYQDFIQREGGQRPLVQDMVGDEDFPILYSVFRRRAVTESTKPTFNTARRPLNVPALIKRGAIFITHPHSDNGWETDRPTWDFSLITLQNVLEKSPPWSVEYKKYLRPESYREAIGSQQFWAGLSDDKYKQILWSIKKLGIPDEVAFLDKQAVKTLDEQQPNQKRQATARQVLAYINKTHHEPFRPGEKMYRAVMAHPRWELQRVPLLNLNLPDQEYDDVDYYDNPPESDPYGRVMTVEPGHAGEVSQHLVDRNPIVIDADRYIIDGNHRAWAAKYLLNRDYINAWVPVEQIKEDQEEYLYHATYRPLLKSIKAKGLGNTTQSQWTDSQPGVVYLARDPEVARSYAEAAESVPEEWLDQIVVLQIIKSKLNPKLLHRDRNVQDNTGDTLEYHAVIPAKLLSVNNLNEVNYPDELTVSDQIQQYFFKRGYNLAGEGRDQMAFESPRGTIVKVLGTGEDEREQIVRRYVKFFEQNQKNPFYPRIYNSGNFSVDEETYFVYEMERVNYVANEEATLDYIEKLMAAVDRGKGAEYVKKNPVPDEIGEKQLAGLLQATEQMMRALGGQAPLDLSAVENLGRRDNGHLVIVDPYSL